MTPRAQHLARGLGLFAALFLCTLLLNGLALVRPHLEGDEFVHRALAEQLRHGRYTLRGTAVLEHPEMFPPAIYDRPLHYNPPLYNVVLLGAHRLWQPLPDVLLSLLLTAGTACLVLLYVRRRGGSGALAAALFLLCPITALCTQKLWSEPLLGLLLFAALSIADRDERPWPGWLALLLCAAALVKSTAVLAVPALAFAVSPLARGSLRASGEPTEAPAAWTMWRAHSRTIAVVVLCPLLTTVAWLAVLALASGDAVPRALTSNQAGLQNPFVAAMANKPPWSFFLLPFLLNPGYLLILLSLGGLQGARRLLPLALFALGILGGYTALALLGVGTFHNKYISIACPALAALAALSLATRRASGAPLLAPPLQRLLGAALILVLLAQWIVLTFFQKPMEEVDPRMFLSWPDWLLGGP